MGDKLANTEEGAQPRLSRRLRDSGTREPDTFPSSGPGAGGPLPSEVDVLSKATLMGDGQTPAVDGKERQGEAQGRSGIPA